MFRFFLTRIALVVPTFLGITALSFFMIRLVPGDPIEVRHGERGITPERLAQLRHAAGLARPLWEKFVEYIGHVPRGDFGFSVVPQARVLREFVQLFPAT